MLGLQAELSNITPDLSSSHNDLPSDERSASLTHQEDVQIGDECRHRKGSKWWAHRGRDRFRDTEEVLSRVHHRVTLEETRSVRDNER